MKTLTQVIFLSIVGLILFGALAIMRLDQAETARLSLVMTTVAVTVVVVGLPAFVVGVMLGVARERNTAIKRANAQAEFPRREPSGPLMPWGWPMLPPASHNGVSAPGVPVRYNRAPESYGITVIGGDQD